MAAKVRSFLIPFVTICFILGASAAVISYGRGYRLDVRQTSLTSTGLVSATSDPIGAQVFVEGTLKTATNNSFNLPPDWYTIRVLKEGYIAWEKRIKIQGEVVTRVDAYLFPTSPSLSPLTNSGVENPVLSPDGSKIAYTIPVEGSHNGIRSKAGLWVLELADRPLGRNRDPLQITQGSTILDFAKTNLIWSPDSAQIMVQFAPESDGRVTLYQTNRANTGIDVTSTFPQVLKEWELDQAIKDRQKIAAFPPEFITIATSSARIISFSPDESKLLYEATASATIPEIIQPPLIGTNSTEENRIISPGRYYVYDMKEDKNYFVVDKSELPTGKVTPTPTRTTKALQPTPTPTITAAPPIFWFPTSRHFVLVLPGKIDVMEYDRTNWITIYSGPFTDTFVAPWTNGSRLIILTNLNPDASTLPNFYTVNLR